MWTISSNDVQQAKERLDRQRNEIETRYAAEKRALEAESAAIEALERVAAEFAQRHALEQTATAMAPPAANFELPSETAAAATEAAGYPEPAGYGAMTETPVDPDTAATTTATAEIGATESAESNLAFDILKPGSRWRLNRASRLLNPEGGSVAPSSTYPPSSD